MGQTRQQKQIYGRRARILDNEFADLATTKRQNDIKEDRPPSKSTNPSLSNLSNGVSRSANDRQPLAEINPNRHPPVKAFQDRYSTNTAREKPASKAKARGYTRPKQIKSSCGQQPQTIAVATVPEYPASPRCCPLEACGYQIHCRPLLNLSTHEMLSFSSWADELSEHFDIVKIAEASFGEVYRVSMRRRISSLTSLDESVFKIIALRPAECTLPKDSRARKALLKKAEAMSKVEDVAMEVKLLQRMSLTPGFTNFRELRVLQGRPSSHFAQAFKKFNKAQLARGKEPSIFPDPARKTSYREDQLWAVIEMQDAGSDLERLLENGQCRSAWAIWDIFWQVCLSLAKGEQDAEFEHRDLHLGNVCVRYAHDPDDESMIKRQKKLNFTGLETTIIDYTISRCSLTEPSSSTHISSNKTNTLQQPQDLHAIAYHDLALPSEASLFEADSTQEYQYEMYRYMRSAAFLTDALAKYPSEPDVDTPNHSWRDFHPVTNLVWLHFLLHKLCETAKWPSTQPAPCKKTDAKGYRRWKRAKELEAILMAVQKELLSPATLCSRGLSSASDLIYVALENDWLSKDDVRGQPAVLDEANGARVVSDEELVAKTKSMHV